MDSISILRRFASRSESSFKFIKFSDWRLLSADSCAYSKSLFEVEFENLSRKVASSSLAFVRVLNFFEKFLRIFGQIF